jgi:kinesin family protein 11
MSRPPLKSRAMPPPPRRGAIPGMRPRSVTPSVTGRVSPADSIVSKRQPANLLSPTSTIGTKRKERDFDTDSTVEETKINVYVRCRGRNDREIRENSGVVVTTNGAKGTTIDLSMGPNALSNKTYYFDRVFAPAADQIMIYDEVVAPILDDVSSRRVSTV